MAARLRALIPDQQERRFDMRALWRLGLWGMSASLALVIAVAAGYSATGSRRPAAAKDEAQPAQKGNGPPTQLSSRLPEIDAETRRLTDAVRSLSGDREQLLARIGTLERSVEDMTGSIKRQTALAAGPAAVAVAPAPAKVAVAVAPSELPPIDSAKPSSGAAEPPPPAPAAAEKVATAPAAVPPEEPPATGFGVDIGGAANFEGLRVLWNSSRNGNAALFEALRPQVVVRENSKTKGAELRLIAGPIATIEEAARLCATFSAGRRYCQPVAFEGQALADAETVPPEHKTERAAARKPAPAAKPKPADPTPKMLRLFR